MPDPTNDLQGLYPTLVAAASRATAVKTGTNALLRSVYQDIKELPAGVGKLLDVALPVESTPTNIGNGALVFSDAETTKVQIAFDQHYSDAKLIRDMEQLTSPIALADLFLDGMLKGLATKANDYIATTQIAGFTTYSAVAGTGTGPKRLLTSDVVGAKSKLAQNKVPVQDVANMFGVYNAIDYGKMESDEMWSSAKNAGNSNAESIRASGSLGIQFGIQHEMDQSLPWEGGNESSSGDDVGTSVLFHRYSTAMVIRPLQTAPYGNAIVTHYVDVDGLLCRVMLSVDHQSLGVIVSVDTCFGLAVVRPDFGIKLTVTG